MALKHMLKTDGKENIYNCMLQIAVYLNLWYIFQVKGADVVSLNPRAGERAVLIKNNKGDWGIVTGKWTGYRKGVAGVTGKDNGCSRL